MEGEAFQYDPGNNYDSHPQLYIRRMSDVCPYCNAHKWPAETRGMCCSGGKVKLPELHPPPEPLESLMSGTTPESKHFLDNIRKYNCCFQMTSFGMSGKVSDSDFMPTFRVQGQVYHRVGPLLPLSNREHQFLQIYFMGDDRKEVKQRCKNMPSVREDIVKKLREMIHEHNVYVEFFKIAFQTMPKDELRVVIRADMKLAEEHARRFNEPVTNTIVVVIAGNNFQSRDIVLKKQNDKLKRISETHRSYDALQYPLIFWEGQDGYHFLIPQTDPTTGLPIKGKKVSAMDFYAYRIMVRSETVNHILRCRQLFHQFVVDMCAKIESERLSFLRFKSKKT
ncbi:hypothetical protein I4U23_000004 [Adineta vaga]|nr:hypothetical protein I4U23_000004 [Adineta vaga]